MSDEEDLVALPGVADCFRVDLGDEGAGGIDGDETPVLSALADHGADAMGAEDDDFAFGDFIERFDEDDASVFESSDDMLVVDDFVEDIDGLAWVEVQDLINDINSHVNACAESTGVCENNFHGWWVRKGSMLDDKPRLTNHSVRAVYGIMVWKQHLWRCSWL